MPVVVSPITYCQFDLSNPLTATATGGNTLHWYTTYIGGAWSLTSPTPSTLVADTQYYYVSQSSAFGCESGRSVISVIVKLLPTDSIVVSPNSSFICQHDTVNFWYFGNGDTTMQYIWTLPAGGVVLPHSGGGVSDTIRMRFDDTGTYTVSLIVKNGQCSGPLKTASVYVKYRPVVTMYVKKDACLDEAVNVELSTASAGIQTYHWNFSNGDTVYASYPNGPFGISWGVVGLHTASIWVAENGCNSYPLIDTVTVHEKPDARITASNVVTICPGDSILLTAKTILPTYSYNWYPAQFFDVNGVPQVYGKGEFNGYISLTVTSNYNCVATDSIFLHTLSSCCVLMVPDAFTPNNDGRNDVLHLLSPGGHHDIAVFRIVNRFGNTVFETNNENIGWDGVYNGVAQDIGTYFYYVRYKCNDDPTAHELKGEVNLIR
jgi:gliding motility-associated-like protein